ncbi:MAG TPA: S41 family peptidase [Acidimicrobiia bacterium]
MKTALHRFGSLWPIIVVVLVLAGCRTDAGPGDTPTSTSSETTSTTVEATTSITGASTTTDSLPEPTGDFEVVPCGEVEGALLCEAYELIQRHYVDPVEDEDLVEGALEALSTAEVPDGEGLDVCPLPSEPFIELCEMIESSGFDAEEAEEVAVAGMTFLALDPNSGYFDAETLELVEEEQSGQIEGIGALVATMEDGSEETNVCQIISDTCHLRIVSTIEGGPAREAGLQEGDEFLAVDGEPIDGLSVDEVTSRVRGPAGTQVELTLLRDGEEFTITLTRAAVQVPVVEAELVGDVAYIRLNVFTDNADEQLRRELEDLLGENPSTIVLDLRNNPGGLLETAINVTSEFLADGLVVTTESPESVTPYPVHGDGIATDPNLELFVVVNRGSASASEVVAGALADADRAAIVGEPTFGKNTVQQRFPLSNGGALKLTIARWLTPAGHDFGGTGITPDVEMDLTGVEEPADVVERVVGSS